MRARGLLILGGSAVLVGALGTPALAQVPGGWVDVDEDESEVGVGATDEISTEEGTGGGGEATECTWYEVPEAEVDSVWWEAGAEHGTITDPDEYTWYWMRCPDGAGGETLDLIPVPRDDPPVDVTVLRDTAVDRLALPRPTIAMNPTGDQVVHVATWLWIDDALWRVHSESVTAGGVTTTVTAEPRRVVWDLGNGDTVVCDGPGVRYDMSRPADEQATDCSYTYTHTSAGQPDDAYQVTATVEWELSWGVIGAAGGGALPPLFTSSPVPVRVAEMQALNQ